MSSLKVEMAKGLMWTAIGKYTGIVISIVVSMVLARLIAPEEFGIVAIAQVAIAFIGVISDMGIGAAIVQNQ
ncbi:oligosaccharide flippase family protein [Prevotella sp. AGR2160]|uniref:oligosaccharide flippase family protein n=1 Tax=Prevotella sp. AGR2160 TaxID=1280674 RepID=UPI0009DC29DC|nr:oligosaccharide flippase family protein [Prevotella sp. AGR2160]